MRLDVVGLAALAEDTLIPGVAVFSRRSVPLAAWTRCVTNLLSCSYDVHGAVHIKYIES